MDREHINQQQQHQAVQHVQRDNIALEEQYIMEAHQVVVDVLEEPMLHQQVRHSVVRVLVDIQIVHLVQIHQQIVI